MAKAQQAKAPPGVNRTYIWLAVFAVLILIPAVALGVRIVRGDKTMARMTRPELAKARKKWEDSGLKSYTLDLNYSGGDQRKFLHLEVRDGEVIECLDNGAPVPDVKRWNDWIIPNLFEMIADDLDKSEKPGGFAVRSNVMITLHGEFDPEYGYPVRYWRKARGNTPLQSKWEIKSFEPTDAK